MKKYFAKKKESSKFDMQQGLQRLVKKSLLELIAFRNFKCSK